MPDSRGQALAEWPGGGFDADGVAVLGVAGGQAAPRAEGLEVGEFQAVPGQEQLDVQRQARVPGGQHEPVAAQPLGVGGIVLQELLEQQVGRRGQTHGRAGVPVAGLVHCVSGQHTGCVHGAVVQVGPFQVAHGIPFVGRTLCAPARKPSQIGWVLLLGRGSPPERAGDACGATVGGRSGVLLVNFAEIIG